MRLNSSSHDDLRNLVSPLVEANWSPDGLGRSSNDGKDPIPLLVTDKSNPGTILSFTIAKIHLFWSFYSKFLHDTNLSTKVCVYNYKLIACYCIS